MQSELGAFEISDQFQFTKKENYKSYYINTLLNESYIRHISNVEPKTIQNYESLIEEKINQIFHLISLIERNRINWTKRIISLKNNNTLIRQKITYRWSSPPSDNYRPKIENKFLYRENILDIFSAFEKLDIAKQKQIIKILYYFQIAYCSPTIETKLIHWHSCLDVLRKEYSYGNNKFSHSIVEIFDKNKIKIDDLVDSEKLDELRTYKKKGCFRFTELRNNYVHDGFDAFHGIYNEVINETSKLRAIT